MFQALLCWRPMGNFRGFGCQISVVILILACAFGRCHGTGLVLPSLLFLSCQRIADQQRMASSKLMGSSVLRSPVPSRTLSEPTRRLQEMHSGPQSFALSTVSGRHGSDEA